METFLELLSVAFYFLVYSMNKKLHSQSILVHLFQKCELSLVKECYGTFVCIWDLRHHFHLVPLRRFVESLGAKLALITMPLVALSFRNFKCVGISFWLTCF